MSRNKIDELREEYGSDELELALEETISAGYVRRVTRFVEGVGPVTMYAVTPAGEEALDKGFSLHGTVH